MRTHIHTHTHRNIHDYTAPYLRTVFAKGHDLVLEHPRQGRDHRHHHGGHAGNVCMYVCSYTRRYICMCVHVCVCVCNACTCGRCCITARARVWRGCTTPHSACPCACSLVQASSHAYLHMCIHVCMSNHILPTDTQTQTQTHARTAPRCRCAPCARHAFHLKRSMQAGA